MYSSGTDSCSADSWAERGYLNREPQPHPTNTVNIKMRRQVKSKYLFYHVIFLILHEL